MFKVILLSIALFSTSALALEHHGKTHHPAEKAISEAYQQIYDAFKKGDVSDIGERYYTKDVLFFPPTGGKYDSQEAVTKVFEGMLAEGLLLKAVPKEIEVYGNTAYERGVGHLYNQQGEPVVSQNYVVIWKKRGDEWRMHRDLVQGIPAN